MNRRTRGLIFQLGSFEELRRAESDQHTAEVLVGSSRSFPGGLPLFQESSSPNGNPELAPAAHAYEYHEFEVEVDQPGGMARTNTGDHPPR